MTIPKQSEWTCARGHSWDGGDWFWESKGKYRICRICRRADAKKRREGALHPRTSTDPVILAAFRAMHEDGTLSDFLMRSAGYEPTKEAA